MNIIPKILRVEFASLEDEYKFCCLSVWIYLGFIITCTFGYAAFKDQAFRITMIILVGFAWYFGYSAIKRRDFLENWLCVYSLDL